MTRAAILGSGPNGLSAAITLARAGVQVTVYEGKDTIGGAVSTGEVTLPGFHHDLGSSIYPMGVASPFFSYAAAIGFWPPMDRAIGSAGASAGRRDGGHAGA